MKQRLIYKIGATVIVVLLLGIIGFYLYDVIILKTEITKNLFRTLATVFFLLGVLVKMLGATGRKGLQIYEKSYEKELGTAFNEHPVYRKKLLCACRLYDESNYNKAIKYLYQLLDEANNKDDFKAVLLFLALCYTEIGLSDEAIKVYNERLKYAANDSQTHSNLGILYLNAGDNENALKHYNKAIDCDRKNYYAFNNRANLYFRVKDYDKAISDAETALAIKNNGKEAAGLLAVIYALKNDRENKEKYFHIAVASGNNAQELREAIELYRCEGEMD